MKLGIAPGHHRIFYTTLESRWWTICSALIDYVCVDWVLPAILVNLTGWTGIVAFNPQFEIFEIWTIGELYALRGFSRCIRGSWNSGELLVSKPLFNLSRASGQRDTNLIARFIADSRSWNDSWGLYKPINGLHWSLIWLTTKQNIQESTIKGPLSIRILENQTISTILKCSLLNSLSTSLLRPWICEFF
jgi:hypothetical protein